MPCTHLISPFPQSAHAGSRVLQFMRHRAAQIISRTGSSTSIISNRPTRPEYPVYRAGWTAVGPVQLELRPAATTGNAQQIHLVLVGFIHFLQWRHSTRNQPLRQNALQRRRIRKGSRSISSRRVMAPRAVRVKRAQHQVAGQRCLTDLPLSRSRISPTITMSVLTQNRSRHAAT